MDPQTYKDKLLGAVGLDKLAEIIKNHVHKKAEIQNTIQIKNPRVVVEGWTNGKTIDISDYKTLNDVMLYLFRNVIPEAQPTNAVVKPTITLDAGTETTVEVGTNVTVTPRYSSFSEGTIGTCIGPWEETPHQSSIASGSVLDSSIFIVEGNSDGTQKDPSATWENEASVSETVAAIEGTTYSKYYIGKAHYTDSSAQSKTSYNKDASAVEGITYFLADYTVPSLPVRRQINGYYPAFGNISSNSSKTYSNTITNLGNAYNTTGEYFEFYVGDLKTSESKNIAIYVKKSLTWYAKMEHYDPLTKQWVAEDTASESGYWATIPAGSTASKFPKKLEEGESSVGKTEYRKIYISNTNMEVASAKWRIKLKNV